MVAPPIVQANKQPLLALVQQACNEMAITPPTQLFGNTDNQAIQLLALAIREGKEFYNMGMRKGGWEALRQENVFSTVGYNSITGTTTTGSFNLTNLTSTANLTSGMVVTGSGIPVGTLISSVFNGTSLGMNTAATITANGVSFTFGIQNYSLPNDFETLMPTTIWDRNFRWQLLGPIDAQEWQVLKSGISPTGPRRRYRIMGNYIYIDPVPSDNLGILAFEYYSNSWCQSSIGTTQTTWKADTDYYTLSDDAFIQGIKWRFKAAKGLDYQQEKKDYDWLTQRLQSRDGGSRDLPLNATASGIRLLNEQNVPDTGFGS